MNRALVSVLGLATLALVIGTVIWVATDESPRHAAALRVATAPKAASPTTAAFEVSATPPPQAATAKRGRKLELVRREVARLQAEIDAHRQGFVKDGWKMVDESPPEEGVTSLDPKLLPAREPELRFQLETAVVSEEHLPNAAKIAAEAEHLRTRVAAIRAIGSSKSDAAQRTLVELFDKLEGAEERRLIIDHIRPVNTRDRRATWLIDKLGDSDIPQGMKKQITFTLVATWFLETSGRPERLGDLLERVPDRWRTATLDTYRLLAHRRKL